MTGEGIRAGQQSQQRATPSTCTVLTNIISILKLGVLSLLPFFFQIMKIKSKICGLQYSLSFPSGFFSLFFCRFPYFSGSSVLSYCGLVAVC